MGVGNHRLRVSAWPSDPRVAHVMAVPGDVPPDPVLLRRCVAALGEQGFIEAITPALAPDDQVPFQHAGFSPREALHLLGHDLTDLPAGGPAASRVRRPRRREWPAMAAVDARAFSAFWHLDATGIAEACQATPFARVRVVVHGDRVAGYAVAGRSGDSAYLQRLAVDPSVHRCGLGRALAADALAWMARRGAQVVLVNTQLTNEAALSLYLRLGFRLRPERLAVLTYPLASAR